MPVSVNAKAIGYLARQTLDRGGQASVIGSTSRGIFILAPGQRIIFVSYEQYRSPLTITLANLPPGLRLAEAGHSVSLNRNTIQMTATGIRLDVGNSLIWAPPLPSKKPDPSDLYRPRLVRIALTAALKKGDTGFASLIAAFLGSAPAENFSPDAGLAWEKISQFLSTQPGFQKNSVAEIIESLLGLGRGLTPSGDDLALGFLLVLNRWQDAFDPRLDLSTLNQSIVRSAYLKTTAISANLIESAVAGQGDERLLAVVDGIMTGQPGEDECVSLALSLGNSSGVDALLGITIGINLFSR
jgi:hypothetical protein